MRLDRVEYPNGRYVHYTYGAADSIADKLSRVDAIKNDNGGDPGATSYAAYSYCGGARLVVEDFITQPELRLDYWGQTTGTYTGLDQFGRIKQQLWNDHTGGGGGTDRDKFSYGYDRNSNRMYRKNELALTFGELYHANGAGEYDGLDRLNEFRRGTLNANKDAITGDDDRRQIFTLNQTGNWTGFQDDAGAGGTGNWDLEQTRENDLANQITNIAKTVGAVWVIPAYDARGNMTSGPKPSGPYTGAAVQETTKLHFKYDAWGRLASIKNDSGGSPGTTVATYEYDAAGRRIRKLIGDPTDPTNTYDYFFNNGWQIIEVRKDGLAVGDLYEQYVWSLRYIDGPILRDRDADEDSQTGDLGKTDSGLEERLYYTTDANMNVTALVNTSGVVQERYVYDAYGKATIYDDDWSDTVTWAASKKNEILYCGYRYDPESNLYHVRNRMYHPTLGRWLQRDPLGYADGMSLYEYVRSSPMNFLDLTGEATTRPSKGASINVFARGTRLGVLSASGLSNARHTGRRRPNGLPEWVPIAPDDESRMQFVSGIAISIDFVSTPAGEAKKEPLCCDQWRYVQTIDVNTDFTGQGPGLHIDNNARREPYYDATPGGLHGGSGLRNTLHRRPLPWFPDNVPRANTTRSMYDAPYHLGFEKAKGTIREDLTFNAEACLVCQRNGKQDVVLNCVTYGFSRKYDKKARRHKPAVGYGPTCTNGPSWLFVRTTLMDENAAYIYGKDWIDR